MERRNFLKHLSVFPTLSLIESLRANEDELKKNGKSAILLWMGGGPSTMDIWDLKPGAPTGGPFKAIGTSEMFRSANICLSWQSRCIMLRL